jgi:hypothetical protein
MTSFSSSDPAAITAAWTRRGRFAPARTGSLKDLLAAVPVDGIERERFRDIGRAVDL